MVVSMLICGLTAMAQDIIVLKDGDLKQVKVIEVGENDVKYKKWENIDGPTYTISISNILSINYQNGAKDSFADYKEKKSDVAQSIDIASNNISKNITTSSNNISRGLNNQVYLSQQRMISSARTLKVFGYITAFATMGTAVAVSALTDVGTWFAPVVGGIGMVSGIAMVVVGHVRINTAKNIASTNLYQHNVNEHFALNACYLEHSPSRQKALGAGVSIRF